MSWTAPPSPPCSAGRARAAEMINRTRQVRALSAPGSPWPPRAARVADLALAGPPMPYTQERLRTRTRVDAGLSWVSRPRRHL